MGSEANAGELNRLTITHITNTIFCTASGIIKDPAGELRDSAFSFWVELTSAFLQLSLANESDTAVLLPGVCVVWVSLAWTMYRCV